MWSTKTATDPVRCASVSTKCAIDAFAIEIFLRELPETIAADLADELGSQAGAAGPHRDVRGAAPGGQHHLAECVAATQQFAVGANEHIPGEVADDAHGCRHVGHGNSKFAGWLSPLRAVGGAMPTPSRRPVRDR